MVLRGEKTIPKNVDKRTKVSYLFYQLMTKGKKKEKKENKKKTKKMKEKILILSMNES
jgi:3-hydroxy-3-methylglutaryl CoA synthase